MHDFLLKNLNEKYQKNIKNFSPKNWGIIWFCSYLA